MQPTASTRMTTRTKLALWLMIGPTGLLITSFILYAVVNFVLGSAPQPTSSSGSLFGDTPVGGVIANVILFIVGSVGVFSWLPAMIVGIVLLATAKPKYTIH